MSDNERLATEEELLNLAKIFDRSRPIETDEDLLELAELVDEEAG